MSDPSTIAWLAALQARFGEALRTPLDRKTGSLRAQTGRYDAGLCDELLPGPETDARERLAVYNRQYWFRLFTTLQREYPLTARLVGMWMFNELAARYLDASPPAHYDLQHVAPGFSAFCDQTLAAGQPSFAGVPSAAILEAVRIDGAYAQVFLAPDVVSLDVRRLSRADFGKMRLRKSPSVAFLAERWPLVELRRSVLREPGTGKLTLPPAHAQVQHWIVSRKGQGHLCAKLEPLAYRLYTALAASEVAEALGAVEASCPPQQRAGLPARVQAWLAESVRAGFWVESA